MQLVQVAVEVHFRGRWRLWPFFGIFFLYGVVLASTARPSPSGFAGCLPEFSGLNHVSLPSATAGHPTCGRPHPIFVDRRLQFALNCVPRQLRCQEQGPASGQRSAKGRPEWDRPLLAGVKQGPGIRPRGLGMLASASHYVTPSMSANETRVEA